MNAAASSFGPLRVSEFGTSLAVRASVVLAVAYLIDNLAPLHLTLSGLNVYVFDLVVVLFGVIAAFNAAKRKHFSALELLVFAIIALSLVQFARGFQAHGYQAGVEFRNDAIALSVIVLLMMAVKHHSRRDWFLCLSVLSSAVILVYLGRATGVFTLSAFDLLYGIGTFRIHRFVTADDALMVAFFAVTCIGIALGGTGRRRSLMYAALGFGAITFSFAMMHRSAWMTAGVALLAFAYFRGRYRITGRGRGKIFVVSGVLLVTAIGVAIAASPIVREAIAEVSATDSTMRWRVVGWQELVASLSSWEFFVGRGYGSDWGRWVNGTYTMASAHNFYVSLLVQLGIIGLVLYVALLLLLVGSLARIAGKSPDFEQRALAALLAAFVVGTAAWFFAYGDGVPNALTIGYAIGFIRQCQIAGSRMGKDTVRRPALSAAYGASRQMPPFAVRRSPAGNRLRDA